MKAEGKNKLTGIIAGSTTCLAGSVILTLGGGYEQGWLALALWIGLATALCGRAASAHTVRPESDYSQSLAKVYQDTAEALASAIAAKDSFEQHHVTRVKAICELVGRALSLDKNELDGICIAALVHDVGKLGVPEYILLKPGPLDAEEFGKMRNHTTIGAMILERVTYPWNVADMVRHHHEKYDGSGYPDHLRGEEIPIGSRIIAVAEVYDSLVSPRCYKDGWPHERTVEHIEKLSGEHFDPAVVSAFLEVADKVEHIVGKHESSLVRAACDDSTAAHMIAQANQELISLFDIAQTLSSTLELDEVLALLAHKTRRLCDTATCAVLLVDELHPRTLKARAAVGRWQEIIKDATATIGRGVTGKAAAHLTPYVGNYDANDLNLGMEGHLASSFKSCLVAPICSFGQLLGTINLYDDATHAFSPDDLRTLTFVASTAALAIQNASAFEQVRDSAVRDPLTGLHNGRYLRTHLEREMRRSSRRVEQLSIIGIDLENFKAVNDSLGHLKGDIVLKDAAAIFQAQLRDYDQVFRNGGDEFVVVLPGTPACEAARIAARIQQGVGGYAAQYAGMTSAPLGASVGIATYPDDAGDIETLLAMADAAMYRDKRARKRDRLAA
ncbi:MAG: diguanylate cyclase [Armatimonadota bacterium]|nr:diguanylate cyclase [bacterium]